MTNAGCNGVPHSTIEDHRSWPSDAPSLIVWIRDKLSALLEAIDGLVLLLPTIVGAPLLRRAYNHWGTTKGEGRAVMRGDELISEPKLSYTRAITIHAPPHHVWPWVVQMGQGRGGLYSYDTLENAIGCDIHSADSIVDELQQVEVGRLIRLGPDGYPAFVVAGVEPPHSLVLVGVDPSSGEPPALPVTGDMVTASTWCWQLRPMDGGTATRLVTRQRLTFPRQRSVLWHVVEPINFVMERRMMIGIKQRAERNRRTAVVAAHQK